MKLNYEKIVKNEKIKRYIKKSDETLIAMGYTDHSFSHVMRVANLAETILSKLDYPAKDIELAKIAGYLHDIGNVVNRKDHAQSGAIIALRLLEELDGDLEDILTIVSAIGHHDDSTAFPVNPITAAVILADKSDVRASRVRNSDLSTFDIHDRVNYATKTSKLEIEKNKYIKLKLTIDTNFCPVMDYFEIFLDRMLLCKKAAEKLGLKFQLVINKQKLL
ncbi:HD domain-containing protein [Fusobacterium sp. PH5-44]|uniref:HD domain-containing protein n=1 Tax=unclassified Fusobacterium TaxID=2648384 RepID=UPI003D2271E7